MLSVIICTHGSPKLQVAARGWPEAGPLSLTIRNPNAGISVTPLWAQRVSSVGQAGWNRRSSRLVTMAQSAVALLAFQQWFEKACSDSANDSGTLRTKRRASTLGWDCKIAQLLSVDPSS